MRRRFNGILATATVIALAVGGVLVQPTSAQAACSSMQYNFGNAILTRQYVYNVSSAAPFWMYQDHKRGSSSAKIGKDATGGKGRAYCGNTYYHSTTPSL